LASPGSKTSTAANVKAVHPPTNSQLIRRLLGLAWQYRFGCVKVLCIQMVLVALALAGLNFVGLGIDFFRYEADNTLSPPHWPFGLAPPAEWTGMQKVWVIAGMILGAAVLHGLLRYVLVVVQTKLVLDIVVTLRKRVYDKLQRLSFKFFDANESGTIINRVTGDVQAVRMFVDRVTVQVIAVGLTLVVFLVYMLYTHVWLTLAVLATTPLMYLGAMLYSRLVRPIFLQNRELTDKLILRLAENIQGIHVIKCFARQHEAIEKFEASNKAVHDSRNRSFRLTSVFVPSIGFLTQINTIVLLVYGGYLVMQHNRDPSTGIPLGTGLIVFSGLLGQFANQIQQIANITNAIQQSLTGAERVFEVLDTEIEIESKPDAKSLPRMLGRVAFEHVTFSYDGKSNVLEDISFVAEPGQIMAILGATGAGKSTLLSMIPRFYDPSSGVVRIDGHDVRDLNLDELRRAVGLVFQENFLFSMTVAENICFGHPDATRQQVVAAAKTAQAHEFISELKHGYDTVIGENGVDLSGGQRQRLAIARALLLQPPILILDDATAAIDPETEHEIHAAMESAMAGRTTFVVAHRLSTLKRADNVVVLHKGRIVQTGTHRELMGQEGQYLHAAALQVADPESRRVLGEEAPAEEEAIRWDVE